MHSFGPRPKLDGSQTCSGQLCTTCRCNWRVVLGFIIVVFADRTSFKHWLPSAAESLRAISACSVQESSVRCSAAIYCSDGRIQAISLDNFSETFSEMSIPFCTLVLMTVACWKGALNIVLFGPEPGFSPGRLSTELVTRICPALQQ